MVPYAIGISGLKIAYRGPAIPFIAVQISRVRNCTMALKVSRHDFNATGLEKPTLN